jgi:hypothetical protein
MAVGTTCARRTPRPARITMTRTRLKKEMPACRLLELRFI